MALKETVRNQKRMKTKNIKIHINKLVIVRYGKKYRTESLNEIQNNEIVSPTGKKYSLLLLLIHE